MGGCGMGRDGSDSVTDSRGRVHGLPWLRVADASLFPDSLEINPYLTIMALADRVAEGVRQDIGAMAPHPALRATLSPPGGERGTRGEVG
jgi:choline dehydrogenase-like flavoprotein